ncbi:FAD-dependent oxidoreductase [Saccharopolyspora sp. HNM0983]|uniref:ferredoxin--NADP(+) reductase n=1 Tax=Saccharopolyspora montiporae TaxID=2781240 RepID=A0A929FYQ6_9PSEU|nr:FAD-dependent oxidoreductase [Saccharopolyspora sp. HNM0983]MBE9373730.1 FAD-dependent oxidoreductase [Saccharopolyspora sp. HNM0983]
MAFAITQTCCNDASCVAVCPVNCIHPTPDEPDFGTTDMLYIDPASCIDCGACADACPVEAIFPVEKLTEALKPYADINAAYYTEQDAPAQPKDPAPNFHTWQPPVFDRTLPSDFPQLDVAVVGSGPAGMYAVEDLLLQTSARVTLIDRLDTAGGLVRYGVAPDHPSTRKIDETFARYREHHRLTLRLGVEVGRDVTTEQLAARHDAVIYAVGASAARELGLPGEQLPGSSTALDVVSWYNGHPDVPAGGIDLSAERAVVVGNGNVALDIARILTADPAQLEHTSISRAALEQLHRSEVREVVVLGRRGPESAAYTTPELLALDQQPGVDVVVDDHDPRIAAAVDAAGTGDKAALLRGMPREAIDWSAPPPHGTRRIALRFHSAPQEYLGADRVRGLRVSGSGDAVDIATGRVITAVGYRGTALPGLPFDAAGGTVPNTGGRVQDRPGSYVVGWIKRGPSGGIGANKTCARETVDALLDDVISGRLVPAGQQRITDRAASALRRLGSKPAALVRR